MYFQDERNTIDTGNRCHIANEIEIEIIVQRRVDCVRRTGQQKCLSVRRGMQTGISADIAAGARAVIDDGLLTQTVRRAIGQAAAQ